MPSLWYCVLIIMFSFTLGVKFTAVFLDENQTEIKIKSPGYPVYARLSYTFWFISALDSREIELNCDIFLSKKFNCILGMFLVKNGPSLSIFCEEKMNLKIKSSTNVITIGFFLKLFGIGKFHCDVRAIPESTSEKPVTEEIDIEEYSSSEDGNEEPVTEEIDTEEYSSSEEGTYSYNGTKSTTCPCGWRHKNKSIAKIIGGKETQVNEYPFMVSLVNSSSNERICGGCIISPRHVLTSAHCDFPPMSAVIGEHNFTVSGETDATRKIDIKEFIKHMNFTKDLMQNDIAVAVLSEQISFSAKVGPACLPTERPFLTDRIVKALGWGVVSTTSNTSSAVLREVNLRVVDSTTCSHYYYDLNPISDAQFCTYAKNKDTCEGDSGGPILWLDPEINRYTLVGIVSFGKSCATIVPGVNTEVSSFINWIQLTVNSSLENNKVNTCMKKVDK